MKKYFVMLICLLTAGWLSAQPLTTAQADSIVKEHNKWRAEVGVAGLTWSDELAASSQKWVDYLVKSGCRFEHSDSDYGENIFYRYDDGSCLEAVLSWAEEKPNYSGFPVGENNGDYGHYTQIVWYNTRQVGCAKAECRDGKQLWVCQYYPAGNWVGEKAY